MHLTLIIPAYNSAATIRRCLDSIYALPMSEEEFEVIVVNDGSMDETGSIVGEYAEVHANLTLIRHLVNRNLGAARNTGLAAAKGNCIAFVDSDDEVAPGMVTALKMMEERELDMVAMRVEKVNEDGTVSRQMELPYSPEEVFTGIRIQEEHSYWCCAVWSYLYSKEFLDRVNYPFAEGVYYEDSDYVCQHFLLASRMAYCDECGYSVIGHPGSITRTCSSNHLADYAYLGVRMLALYESLEDKKSPFAESILEGGSYNIWYAFRKIPRLANKADVRLFYNLLDTRTNRKSLLKYREPSGYWTFWTRFCLRYRRAATAVVGLFVTLYRRVNS